MPHLTEQQRLSHRAHLRTSYIAKRPARADLTLERDIASGWGLGYLMPIDAALWGRWPYWLDALEARRPPTGDIPQIEWESEPAPATLRMLEHVLGELQDQGLGYYEAVRYLLEWLLWSFGDERLDAREITWDAKCSICYQLVDLGLLQLYPYDYWGYLLSEIGHGKRTAFYPTPLQVVEVMSRMTIAEAANDDDTKALKVHDPCVGTGRFLLVASNYSLRLSGQDIDPMVLKGALVSGWLYAPWLVKPLPEDVWTFTTAKQGELKLEAA